MLQHLKAVLCKGFPKDRAAEIAVKTIGEWLGKEENRQKACSKILLLPSQNL